MASKPPNGARYPPPEFPPGDLVTDWFQYCSTTQDDLSPEIFRKWAGISMVAGAMERRIRIKAGMYYNYCNLYTVLVGPSGAGKKIVDTVRRFWTEVKDPDTNARMFNVAPHSITKAALVDRLGKSGKKVLNEKGVMETHHPLLVAAEEMKRFLSEFDADYIGLLEHVWNNPDDVDEERRFGVTKAYSEKPYLNILAGAQPAYFSTIWHEEVWNMGLARRLVMVYSSERRIQDPFTEYPDPVELKERILAKLAKIGGMYGTIEFSPEARELFTSWIMAGSPEVPQHSRLQGYVNDRGHFAKKLAGISSVSRKLDLTPVDLVDVERALEWMFEIERLMPEVFKAMSIGSGMNLIEELHRAMTVEWHRNGKRPIPGAFVWAFVGERTSPEKVEKIISIAAKVRAIEALDNYGGLWKPLPKVFRGGKKGEEEGEAKL